MTWSQVKSAKRHLMDLQATVIIPTFEDWDGLQLCLDCLDGQSADPGLFEVIVANNNRAPDIPPSLRLAPNVRVIHASKPGSYAARNAAIGVARGKVLFFTDSDCLPDLRWIEAGLSTISPLSPWDLVAGAIELFPEGKEWTSSELYYRVHHMLQEEYAKDGWCATANLVARREAFERVGLFSEDRFSGGDKEWTSRATAMGSRLAFGPEVLIRHPARTGFAELAKKRRRLIGGSHQAQELGRVPKRSTISYLSFLSYDDIRRTMSCPSLTDWQRVQVMGTCFLLGMVSFAEIARLRYFSGEPSRS
jgi:GT2 family glycosyltransferase